MNAFPKHQAVRRPSKVEHADLVALLHPLPLRHSNVARRHFGHTHTDKGHQPHGRVVGLEEDQRPRRRRGEIALRGHFASDVDAVRIWVWIPQSFKQRFRVVRPVDDVGVCHRPTNGRVPAVVAQRAEISLIHSAADELLRQGIVR